MFLDDDDDERTIPEVHLLSIVYINDFYKRIHSNTSYNSCKYKQTIHLTHLISIIEFAIMDIRISKG
eukprot:GAHX01005271.1.p1 GENE.GAHX01005271.1~~GAHX01005271.1.p1  ORF type:complete len:67 (+),score=8.09 GAHX01005271.1:539-739(+)